MRLLRSVRRAPARLLASVLALALAVAALGMFAVPSVANGTLREMAAADHLAHLSVDITPIGSLEGISLDGVSAIEGELMSTVDTTDGDTVTVVGAPLDREVNTVRLLDGRVPAARFEALASEGTATVGQRISLPSGELTVVGIGATAWWSGEDVLFTDLATAAALTGIDGVNRVVARFDDPSAEHLDEAVRRLRAELGQRGVALRDLPVTLPGGRHPIEEDLEVVSSIIGLLGVVAGLVALVLLASTTNTVITERTREVAVMRALGARRRPLRARLRRIALGIAVAGVVLGLPLGVAVANIVARMVLHKFLGITPELGVSVPVMAASAAFALIGARLVAARAARRVSGLPLAESLRDREGAPFGRRWSERAAGRISIGGLFGRLSARNLVHHRARSLAIAMQLASATAAAIVVASLGTSVDAFNADLMTPYRWDRAVHTIDPGLGYDAATAPGTEAAIVVDGVVDDWDVEVDGLIPATSVIDTAVTTGRWLDGGDGVVISEGFARRRGIGLGDTVTIELASGAADHPVIGLHPLKGATVFVDREVLAADLGQPGRANWLYATTAGVDLHAPAAVASESVTIEQFNADSAAGRAAIVAIFRAIGVIVVAVALLGVGSAMAVEVHERRVEMATIGAIGGRRRHLRRALTGQLVPLAVIGWMVGVGAGWLGALGIIGFFERINSLDIGTELAASMVPISGVASVATVMAIGSLGARRAATRPIAATLRAGA